ncbi:MAG: hypothetical protein KDB23_21800 [Planctomycetales bacterium]|nr:hypothetical protein [Planctomycetales bacterium]
MAVDFANETLLERDMLDSPVRLPAAGSLPSRPDEGELGDRVFRDAQLRSGTAMVIVVVGVLILGACYTQTRSLWVSLIPCVIVIAILERLSSFSSRLSNLIHLHEYGMVVQQADEQFVLSYDDLESVSINRTILTHRGVPTGATEAMQFTTNRGRVIEHTFQHSDTSGSSKNTSWLIGKVNEAIGRQMLDQLQETGRAKWTDRLTLLPDGIECAFGPGTEPVVYPYETIGGVEFVGEEIKLDVEYLGTRTQLCQQSHVTNFYPGFDLLQRLVRQMRAEPLEIASA